jgi:O-antigen/teichoic acid export membrane protein
VAGLAGKRPRGRVAHASRRTSTAILLRLFRIWLRVNLALLLAFGIALMVGTPLVTTLGAAVAVWALAGFAFWRLWRRSGSAPWERAAHASPRRK